jgi:hypothetical protein
LRLARNVGVGNRRLDIAQLVEKGIARALIEREPSLVRRLGQAGNSFRK